MSSDEDRRGVVVAWSGGGGEIRDVDTGEHRPVPRAAIWPSGGLPEAQRRLCPGEHVRYQLSAADEHGAITSVRGAWHDSLICHRGRATLRPPPIRASAQSPGCAGPPPGAAVRRGEVLWFDDRRRNYGFVRDVDSDTAHLCHYRAIPAGRRTTWRNLLTGECVRFCTDAEGRCTWVGGAWEAPLVCHWSRLVSFKPLTSKSLK